MSEISEAEIKAMTKEQNYIRGYKDGKSDVLDKIKAEANADCISDGIDRYIRFDVLEKIINKHKAESEDRE